MNDHVLLQVIVLGAAGHGRFHLELPSGVDCTPIFVPDAAEVHWPDAPPAAM
jgi:hypothetical protein